MKIIRDFIIFLHLYHIKLFLSLHFDAWCPKVYLIAVIPSLLSVVLEKQSVCFVVVTFVCGDHWHTRKLQESEEQPRNTNLWTPGIWPSGSTILKMKPEADKHAPSGHRGWGRYLYSGIARVSASGSGVVIIWGMFRVRPFTTFWSTSSTVSSGASATPLLQLSEDQTKKQRLDFRYWPPPSRAFTAETPKVSLKLFQKRFPKGVRNAVTLRIFIRLHLFVFYGLKRKPPGV